MEINKIFLLVITLIIFIGIPIVLIYYYYRKKKNDKKPECKKHWSNWIDIENGTREVRQEIAEEDSHCDDKLNKEYRFTQKFIDSAKNKYQLDGNIEESTLKNEDESLKDLVQSRYEAEKNSCKKDEKGTTICGSCTYENNLQSDCNWTYPTWFCSGSGRFNSATNCEWNKDLIDKVFKDKDNKDTYSDDYFLNNKDFMDHLKKHQADNASGFKCSNFKDSWVKTTPDKEINFNNVKNGLSKCIAPKELVDTASELYYYKDKPESKLKNETRDNIRKLAQIRYNADRNCTKDDKKDDGPCHWKWAAWFCSNGGKYSDATCYNWNKDLVDQLKSKYGNNKDAMYQDPEFLKHMKRYDESVNGQFPCDNFKDEWTKGPPNKDINPENVLNGLLQLRNC